MNNSTASHPNEENNLALLKEPYKKRTLSIYVLLTASIVMAAASGVITYLSTAEKQRALERVEHTHRVIQTATELLSLLKDMETGQRGYIITRDSDFLIPYDSGASNLTYEIQSLQELVSENTDQTVFLAEEIIPIVNEKYAILEKNILVLNTFGQDSAIARIAQKVGMAYMDSLRLSINEFVGNEQLLLAQRNKTLQRTTALEDYFQFSSFAVISITLLFAFKRIVRERQRNAELVVGLQSANNTLEQKVAERTAQLVNANEAKNRFLGIATHDLKAPLSGVLGLIDIMRKENPNRPSLDTELLDFMQQACHNMHELILNLLDINKIERGGISILKKQVEAATLLRRVYGEFHHVANKKNITLTIDIVKGSFTTDADALIQVLQNLLSNAIKFSKANTQVRLETIVTPTLVTFHVHDQGPGISEEDFPKLFGVFQKLSNKPTGGEGSTGLGLSIVKEITNRLGGDITVTSEVGKGTTFTVVIPH